MNGDEEPDAALEAVERRDDAVELVQRLERAAAAGPVAFGARAHIRQRCARVRVDLGRFEREHRRGTAAARGAVGARRGAQRAGRSAYATRRANWRWKSCGPPASGALK